MKPMMIAKGLHPLARVRQTLGRSRPERAQPSNGVAPRIVARKPPRAGRRAGLSRASVSLFRIIACGTEPGRPRGAFLAWPGWEHIAHRLWPTVGIPNAPYGLLRMRLKAYKGQPLTLPGDTTIGRNALVGELHCNNPALLHQVLRHRVNPYRACREDLRCLAAWAGKDSLGIQVEAFFGRTMLAVGAARMGFAVRDVRKGPWLWLERFFMIGLLLLYTESGLGRLTRGTTVLSYPKEVWISRDQLMKRYGDRTRHGPDRHHELNGGADDCALRPPTGAIDLSRLPGERSEGPADCV
jgi:hypothetical protein